MKILPMVLMVVAATVAPGPNAAAADAEVDVLRLDVRFQGKSSALEAAGTPLRGKLRFTGDVLADRDVTRWAPATDHLRLTVGPLVLVDGPDYAGRVKTRTGGRWRLDLRARDALGPKSRLRVRFDALTGVLDLKASRVDVRALRDAGSRAVPIVLEIGEATFTATLDLDDRRDRHWSYRHVAPPGHGPGGGGGGGNPPPPPPPPSPLGWSVLRTGDWSSIKTARRFVIRDQASFDIFWNLHSSAIGGGTKPPVEVPPSVDWSRDMVVAIFTGSSARAGADVKVDSVATAGNGAVVRYTESRPGAGCPILFRPVDPYEIVRVSRVVGTVTFEPTVTVSTCK